MLPSPRDLHARPIRTVFVLFLEHELFQLLREHADLLLHLILVRMAWSDMTSKGRRDSPKAPGASFQDLLEDRAPAAAASRILAKPPDRDS